MAHRMICCPFHEEKTPSMILKATGVTNGVAHCFGCGVTINYVEELDYRLVDGKECLIPTIEFKKIIYDESRA